MVTHLACNLSHLGSLLTKPFPLTHLAHNLSPFPFSWTKHLPTVEFALNLSMNKSTGFAPFELTYGCISQTIQPVGTSEYAGIQEYAKAARDMVAHAHNAMIASCIEQTHYANTRHHLDVIAY